MNDKSCVVFVLSPFRERDRKRVSKSLHSYHLYIMLACHPRGASLYRSPMRKPFLVLSAIFVLVLSFNMLFSYQAEAMFREGILAKDSRFFEVRGRANIKSPCIDKHARYNQQTDRCECRPSINKPGYCSLLKAGSGTTVLRPLTEGEKRCGLHGEFLLSKGCACEPGYKRMGGQCEFRGCPPGHTLNKDKQCIVRGTVFQRKEDWKLCKTTRPCTCDAGYEPMGNRTCIPK